MARYIIKRILLAIPVLIGATFLVFTILFFTPSDPARMILGSSATEEAIEAMNEELGINDPFFVRYFNYMKGLVQGDMGRSYRNNSSVSETIAGRLGNTLILASAGMLFAIIIGIPVGILSAVKQYSKIDNATMFITLFLTAVPTFWYALILVIIFALKLHWLPASGMGVGLVPLLKSLILPTITLGSGYAAMIAITTRSSVLEVIRQDYIDTARAKGVSEKTVIWKHMLKNALIPIVTVVGLNFGSLLGGSVLTETIFSWPGVGRYVVDSISYRDTNAVLGSVVTLTILFTIVNLAVDIIYALIDPRIKSQYAVKRRKKHAQSENAV